MILQRTREKKKDHCDRKIAMKFQTVLRSCALVFAVVVHVTLLGTCSASEGYWRLVGDQSTFDPSVVLSAESRLTCAIQCNISPLNCKNFYWVSSNKTCYLTVKHNVIHAALQNRDGRFFEIATMSQSQCQNGGVFDSSQGSCNCTGTDFQGENCTEPAICKNGGQLHPVYGSCNCDNTGYTGANCTDLVCPETLPANALEMKWTTREINQLRGEILRCEQDYMPSFHQAEVLCVNDVWIGAMCSRRILHNPAKAIVHPLPRPMEVGWKICIHGYPTYTTNTKRFSFLLRENYGTSWITGAYFDYRLDHDSRVNTTIFNTLSNGVFTNSYLYGQYSRYPFLDGRNFTMYFTVLGQTELTNNGTSDGETISAHYTTYNGNLMNVIGFFYNHFVVVTYVDLWCHEPLP